MMVRISIIYDPVQDASTPEELTDFLNAWRKHCGNAMDGFSGGNIRSIKVERAEPVKGYFLMWWRDWDGKGIRPDDHLLSHKNYDSVEEAEQSAQLMPGVVEIVSIKTAKVAGVIQNGRVQRIQNAS